MRNKTAAWYDYLTGKKLGLWAYDTFLADADGLLLLKSNKQALDLKKETDAILADDSLSMLLRQRKKDELWSDFNKKNLQQWKERTDRIRTRNKNLSYAQLFVDGFNPIGAFIDYGITPEQKAAMYSYYGVDPAWAMGWNLAGNVAQLATTGLIGKGLQATKLLKPAAWAADKGLALVKRIPGIKKATDFIGAAGKFTSNKYGQGVNWLLSKTTPGSKANKVIRGTSNFVGHSAAKASLAFAPLMGAYVADKTLTGLALNYDANSWQHKWLAGSADVFNKAVGFRSVSGATGASKYNIMNMMASPAMQRAAQNDMTRNTARNMLVLAHRIKHDIAYSMNATQATVRKLESGDIKASLLQNTLDPVVSLYIKAYAALSKMTLEELRNKLADSGYALKFRALMIPALKLASSNTSRQMTLTDKTQSIQPAIDKYLFMLRYGRQDPSFAATLAGVGSLGITNNVYSNGQKAAYRLKKMQEMGKGYADKYKQLTSGMRRFYNTTQNIDRLNFGTTYISPAMPKLPLLIYGKTYGLLTPLLRKVMNYAMTIPNYAQALDVSDNIQDMLTIGPSRSMAAMDRQDLLRPYYSERMSDSMSPSSRLDAVLRGKLRLALLKLQLPKITDPIARNKAMELYRQLLQGVYATAKLLLIIDRANPVNWSNPYTYTPLLRSGQTAGILNELVSVGNNPKNTPMRADNFYDYSNKLMDLLYTTANSPADAVLLLLNAPDIFGLTETRSLQGDQIPVFKAYTDGLMLRLMLDSSMDTSQKLKLLNKVRLYIISAAESASPIMRAKLLAMTLSLLDAAYSIKNGEY